MSEMRPALFSLTTQSELSEKDRQVQRYQDLLQQARQELRDSAHTHKQELASLTAQLHTQTDSTVTRLREAALEIANISPPNVVTDDQLVRLRELEDLCVEREREGARLMQQVGVGVWPVCREREGGGQTDPAGGCGGWPGLCVCVQHAKTYTHVHVSAFVSNYMYMYMCMYRVYLLSFKISVYTWSSAPSVWDYNYFVVCCHPNPLLHPPDTTTPLLARYLLIKIWLPDNRLQMYMYGNVLEVMLYCVQVEALKRELEAAMTTHESDVGRMREKMKELKGQHQKEVKGQ